jgi:hypothetical protein
LPADIQIGDGAHRLAHDRIDLMEELLELGGSAALRLVHPPALQPAMHAFVTRQHAVVGFLRRQLAPREFRRSVAEGHDQRNRQYQQQAQHAQGGDAHAERIAERGAP